MTVMVGFNIVTAAVLGFLAVLCVIASLSLRRNVPLAWVAAALGCGTIQTLLITFVPDNAADFFVAAVMGPLGYVLAGQSIYALAPLQRWRRPVIAVVCGLSGLSIALHALSVPVFVQLAMFQLACTIAMADATIRVMRQPRGRLLDLGLIAAVAALWLTTAVRLAVFLWHGAGISLDAFNQSPGEALYLQVSSLLTPVIIILLLARITSDTIATFQHQSERDGLTGLLNRRAFDAVAAGAKAGGGAVIFCDLDHFKQVNDRYGHQAGDEVIRTFAELIDRTGHCTGRLGGEEFAVLLPGGSIAEASAIAEMIRERFRETQHAGLMPDHRLSASFGVADYVLGEAAKDALTRADFALYAAKEAGRNRVMTFPAATPPTTELVRPQQAA